MRLTGRAILITTVVLLILLVAAAAAVAAKPSKVIIITMDQMKPGYVNAYDMTNMKWLQKKGVHFKNAYVGQLASTTVVSHNSIVSGQLPKHQGWSDEVIRDVDDVLGYGAGAIITIGDLTYDQYTQIIEYYGYPKLGDYMKWKYPDATVACFGEKYYQVASTAASSADWYMTFGGKKNVADLPNADDFPWTGKYRTADPAGGVPDYIMNDDRFKISSGNADDKYGTNVDWPAWTYPEDGRHVPGPYDEHLSGDDWVVDGAIKLIENDPWSAMHLNFSGIDKIGHMYGGGPVDTLANFEKYNPAGVWLDMVHMAFIAKNADKQVGRLIAALKKSGDWNKTLFVVLADHGVEAATKAWYGITDQPDMGYDAWFYDPNEICANTAYGRPGSNNEDVLGPLNADGNLAYSYQSVMMEAWLIKQSVAKKLHTARVMSTMDGVLATYIRFGDRYQLVWNLPKKKMTASEYTWWKANAQKLVDTMAWKGAADVIGLLKDGVSYGGAYGDHGGATKGSQRVPMVFWAKGIKPKVRAEKFRLVDVVPTALRTMGIPQLAPMDGKAYKLAF